LPDVSYILAKLAQIDGEIVSFEIKKKFHIFVWNKYRSSSGIYCWTCL